MSSTVPARATVDVERRDRVAVVRYHNAPTGLIANKGAAALLRELEILIADAGVHVIVLTGGQAGVFIRHADVGQILRAGDALASGTIAPESFLEGPFPQLGQLLDTSPKPVIAAINGICMGGGLEIALACTTRIADTDVQNIGLPEIRLGIFPGAGGTLRLPRLLGLSRARLFMLRGAVVTAREALSLGIVDEIAPCALTRALALADELASRPPAAVAAILQLTRPAVDDADLHAEQAAFAGLLRDEPAVRTSLRRFVEDGRELDKLD